MKCCGKNRNMMDSLVAAEFGTKKCNDCFKDTVYTHCECGQSLTGQQCFNHVRRAPRELIKKYTCDKCDKKIYKKCVCNEDITLMDVKLLNSMKMDYDKCFKCFHEEDIEKCECGQMITGSWIMFAKMMKQPEKCQQCLEKNN